MERSLKVFGEFEYDGEADKSVGCFCYFNVRLLAASSKDRLNPVLVWYND